MAVQSAQILSQDELAAKLAEQPRVELGTFPTPLDACPRLSDAVGGPPIYIKRDDLTGLALGGNKTRNLEFQIGSAVAQGCDTVVAGADTQSNQCRQASAACAKVGLDCHLVLSGGLHNEVQGNLLLDHIFGANVTVLEDTNIDDLQDRIDPIEAELQRQGRKTYRISSKFPDPALRAMCGYLSCALEFSTQLPSLPQPPSTIFITSGSGTTHAGFAAGIKVLGLPTKVVGISIKEPADEQRETVAARSQMLAEQLEIPCGLSPDEVFASEDYLGTGYGEVTDEGMEAIRLTAQLEGILLEPVYTGKTMSGLIGMARAGELPADQPVIMVHTGGIPALFAYHEEMMAAL
ncbi:MAG: D-cysteine desulfhydrase family protein [Chloroflexota bacterium]|nr:D-cysteine desulfhydrase family protein [Chloroflexota bacterium]MDE2841057.1 D-cysteine desulfhydrase family protein [Chloroflexota bacterium]MDE2931039.1 D-cysteine desulfhydrase family protein [Chloroflexota bacterium]